MSNHIIRIFDAVNEWSGRIAGVLCLLLMLWMSGLVAARYALGVGSVAAQEAVLWLHASVFLLALGYALKHDAHVRVDVFAQRLSADTRRRIEIAGHLLLVLPLCVFILWVSADYVLASWSQREGSNSGGLPGWYLVKTLIPLSALLLAMQSLAQIGKALWPNGERA